MQLVVLRSRPFYSLLQHFDDSERHSFPPGRPAGRRKLQEGPVKSDFCLNQLIKTRRQNMISQPAWRASNSTLGADSYFEIAERPGLTPRNR